MGNLFWNSCKTSVHAVRRIDVCRLMALSISDLYELHYQMITLGKVRKSCSPCFAQVHSVPLCRFPPLFSSSHPKSDDDNMIGSCHNCGKTRCSAAAEWLLFHLQVICTKAKPNCSACPLQASCEYAQSGGDRWHPPAAKQSSGVSCRHSPAPFALYPRSSTLHQALGVNVG